MTIASPPLTLDGLDVPTSVTFRFWRMTLLLFAMATPTPDRNASESNSLLFSRGFFDASPT